ncbi:RluA family pseudouridine synthase [bacterium]|nr:RluA family pseudouridine synthase [bacterium]
MSKKYFLNVQSLSEPLRLDVFLSSSELFSSRSQVQNLIKKSQIYVNGEIHKSSFLVNNDDEITIVLGDENSVVIEPENILIDIKYEDDDVIVVNKPKNMLTHPTEKEIKGTLVNALLYRYGYDGLSTLNGFLRPGIVHRLDRNTTGLLIVTKNNVAHEFISNQIKNKTAIRKYHAVVFGNFENEQGVIDLPIGRNPKKPEKMSVVEDGKPSITEYRVVEQFKGFSYLELNLKTGRTHQIRAHMSHIGHPIVNDSLYTKLPFKVKTIEQVLQSYSLKFTTLKNNDIIELEIPPDVDLEKTLRFLRSNK